MVYNSPSNQICLWSYVYVYIYMCVYIYICVCVCVCMYVPDCWGLPESRDSHDSASKVHDQAFARFHCLSWKHWEPPDKHQTWKVWRKKWAALSTAIGKPCAIQTLLIKLKAPFLHCSALLFDHQWLRVRGERDRRTWWCLCVHSNAKPGGQRLCSGWRFELWVTQIDRFISNHSVGHQQAAFLLKNARDAFAKGHKGIERDSYHKYMNKSTWAARKIT